MVSPTAPDETMGGAVFGTAGAVAASTGDAACAKAIPWTDVEGRSFREVVPTGSSPKAAERLGLAEVTTPVVSTTAAVGVGSVGRAGGSARGGGMIGLATRSGETVECEAFDDDDTTPVSAVTIVCVPASGRDGVL
jgi:hypothetical protein